MAHIFKHPSGGNKGIINFTHKEARFLLKKKRSEKVNFLKKKTNFEADFSRIKESYYIGVHVGWLMDFPDYFDRFDFVLATGSVLNEVNDRDIFVIPLRTRNFTPSFFNTDNTTDKYWDIVCVSNNSRNKRLEDLLNSVKAIYEAGYQYRVLLVSSERKDEKSSDKFYNELIDDYNEKFSKSEKELFTIMRLSSDMGFIALPQTTIAFLLKSSKVFTLFSALEGGPKVISEALLSGCPIVVYKDLQGGGRDYLNDKNAVFFDSYDTAHEALIEAVENYPTLRANFPDMRDELGEEASLKKLKEYFGQLFAKNGQTFDGELINDDNLNLRLCSHINTDIPWTDGRFGTADIRSREQWEIFINHLTI